MSSALRLHACFAPKVSSFNSYSKVYTTKSICGSLRVKMDLVLESHDKPHPYCPHGPTFLFQKRDVKRKSSRKFFACSANRDRKFCQFFHWADEPITQEKQKLWESVAQQHVDSLDLRSLRERQERLATCTPKTHLKYCKKCSLILFPNEWEKHSNHGPLQNVPFGKRMEPTSFFTPLEEKKTNAQYFFSDKCVKFIVDSLIQFNIKRVLCIGAPRILEHVLSRKEELDMVCLLMDIDHRYAQFYSQKNFVLYNLFNHHFFEGPTARLSFKEFVTSPDTTALVIDPPFGGMIGAIASTIRKISDCRRPQQMPVFLIFPYFNEDRIRKEMPSLRMLDYKVNYVNHDKFKEGGMKQGSVVRIFTDLDAAKFVLPADEGYKFCSICERFVYKENLHCTDCNACTSKDGRPYKHCEKCDRCCKTSWEHCPNCDRCALPSHPCLKGEVHPAKEDLNASPFKGNSRKRAKLKPDSV